MYYLKHNMNQYKTFKKQSYVYYINYNGYKPENMRSYIDVPIKKNKDENNHENIFIVRLPLYQYHDEFKGDLMIKTSFIKLNKAPVLVIPPSGTTTNRGNDARLELDPYSSDVYNMLDALIQYDIYVRNTMKNIFEEYCKQFDIGIYNEFKTQFKASSSLVHNKYNYAIDKNATDKYNRVPDKNQPLEPISVHFSQKENKIINRIINYNISRKYPAKEIHDAIDDKELRRILSKGKEIRLILKPISWYNITNKVTVYENGVAKQVDGVTMNYGSKLNLFMMEIRYAGKVIESEIDKNEIDVIDIDSIEI